MSLTVNGAELIWGLRLTGHLEKKLQTQKFSSVRTVAISILDVLAKTIQQHQEQHYTR